MMQSEQSPLVSLLLLLVLFSLMLGSATPSVLPLCRGAGWGWELLPSFVPLLILSLGAMLGSDSETCSNRI